MQQHNTWGKDRNDLASLAGQVITEGYSSDEEGVDFDALFYKKHDRMPESQDESDSHLFDVLNDEVSNGVSKAELIGKYGEDAVATYERFGEENDRFEGPFEDAENPEVFQLLASVGELDADSMEEFLYGLANIFDDPDVTDRAFELTFGHIGDAYDAFKSRSSN